MTAGVINLRYVLSDYFCSLTRGSILHSQQHLFHYYSLFCLILVVLVIISIPYDRLIAEIWDQSDATEESNKSRNTSR